MIETEREYPPLPPDDLNRTLTVAQPDNNGKSTHIGLVGDTYIGREVSSWKGQLVGYNLGLTMRPTPARQH